LSFVAEIVQFSRCLLQVGEKTKQNKTKLDSLLSALQLDRCLYLFKKEKSGSCLAGLVAEPGVIRDS